MALLTPTNVKDICKALRIHPTKTLGQNFVHDAGTVRKIVAAARVTADEHILEVGPGLGSLTLGLLEAGARVTAIEIDPVLATALPATVAGHGGRELRVINRDAIAVTDPAELNEAPLLSGEYVEWDAPSKLVANLPYNVAVPLVLSVLENYPTISELLVMVQTEVAKRLCAAPGGRIYGVPTVKVGWYGTATMAGSISRSVFWPIPNVDSSLVRIQRHTPGEVDQTGTTREAVFALVDAAFAQRRKTLRAALKNWAGSSQDAVRILESAGIEPTRRGETLSVREFIELARARER
ncbi:MAG: 16S rRNA (adenine(1518)-N(6)/adenine(1519)-N(6))-dimethyltransferase RsmA [Actinomycetaceae bacterium]|nr:16S rRNA (adenine(1518)-N(6)/adenine(1519)-N(6))-dimethyltransferase RsmA [Actinomycetaceae bacterium]